MDRNTATGLFLISALLLIYLNFFASKPEDAKNRPAKPTTGTAAVPAATPAPAAAGTAPAAVPAFTPEAALDSAAGPVRSLQLKNKNLTVSLSSRGGRITAVRLNEYKTFFGQPMDLLDAQSARLDTRFRLTTGQTVNFANLNFQPSAITPTDKGGQRLTFTAPVAGGTIEQTYTLPADSYEVNYNLKLNNLQNSVAQEPLTFTFQDRVRQTEQDRVQNQNQSTINHHTASGDNDEVAAAGETPEEKKVAEPLGWAAHKHGFFVVGFIADSQPFVRGEFNAAASLTDKTFIKAMTSTLALPVADVTSAAGGNYRFFFGPNSFNLLQQVAPEFDRNVFLGWGPLRLVNRYVVLPVFHFLEQYISSYGLIIALLVLLIKLVTWPLTYKTYESQARMKVLKPEIDALKVKIGDDDPTKLQQETMKLYSTFGVSPLGGCIPTLLTIPILFALFQFFPNAIELRQESFLWAKDLSSYDVFAKLPFAIKWYGDHVSMFTILMTISTLLQTYQSNQVNAQMQGPMKFYSYLMPVIFLFVLNSFAAGLTWYYFVSNVVTLAQQAIQKGFVDEDKIRVQLEANKVKNKDKKPSGFQARLTEAMKNAQEREAQAKKKI